MQVNYLQVSMIILLFYVIIIIIYCIEVLDLRVTDAIFFHTS